MLTQATSRQAFLQIFNADTGHVEVELRKLPNARMLWLNQRAMLEDPAYLSLASDRDAYEQWLLERCAYVISDEPLDGKVDAIGIADRYGGSGIGHNGGSGRAAFIHEYHVKGIGRTPLVSVLTDRLHGSGGAYLEECVREAIFSELAAAEFPGDAVPVLAIIETGDFQTWTTDHGPKEERRCLLVRPAFMRPAHFERATGFITHNPKEGADDASRVACTFEAASKILGKESMLAMYHAFWPRWAAQLAYAFAHRLAHGGNTSSNISLDGHLVDFGAMAAMPSWARISTMTGGAPVGLDMTFLVQALQMQSHFWGRYMDEALATPAAIAQTMASASTAYQHQLFIEVLRILGLSRHQARRLLAGEHHARVDSAIQRLLAYFQRDQFAIFAGTPAPRLAWDVTAFWSDDVPPHLRELRTLVEHALGPEQGGAAALQMGRNRLRAASRPGVYRETIKEDVYAALDRAYPRNTLTSRIVGNLIDDMVTKHRRDSHVEPDNLVPIGFARNARCAYALHECPTTHIRYAIQEWNVDAEIAVHTPLPLKDMSATGLHFAERHLPDFSGAVWTISRMEISPAWHSDPMAA